MPTISGKDVNFKSQSPSESVTTSPATLRGGSSSASSSSASSSDQDAGDGDCKEPSALTLLPRVMTSNRAGRELIQLPTIIRVRLLGTRRQSGTVPGTVPDCRCVPSSRTLIIVIVRWRCSAHFFSIPDTVITVNFWIPAFGLGVLVVVLCCCCQLADYCSAQSTRLRARRSRLHQCSAQ